MSRIFPGDYKYKRYPETMQDQLHIDGFTIKVTCKKCGGEGFVTSASEGRGSEETGEWCSLELTCEQCGATENVNLI